MQHKKKDCSVTLVLGGVRSGKSRYAQQLAQGAERITVLATAQAREDDEMRYRIARHRRDRPVGWVTIEEPLALGATLERCAVQSDIVLIDCLTLFTANLLEAEADDESARQAEIERLCTVLQSSPCRVILVSNEVGCGVVPAYALGRQFRDLAGEINQRIAAIADTVLLMVAGLPLALKTPAPAGSR